MQLDEAGQLRRTEQSGSLASLALSCPRRWTRCETRARREAAAQRTAGAQLRDDSNEAVREIHRCVGVRRARGTRRDRHSCRGPLAKPHAAAESALRTRTRGAAGDDERDAHLHGDGAAHRVSSAAGGGRARRSPPPRRRCAPSWKRSGRRPRTRLPVRTALRRGARVARSGGSRGIGRDRGAPRRRRRLARGTVRGLEGQVASVADSGTAHRRYVQAARRARRAHGRC